MWKKAFTNEGKVKVKYLVLRDVHCKVLFLLHLLINSHFSSSMLQSGQSLAQEHSDSGCATQAINTKPLEVDF